MSRWSSGSTWSRRDTPISCLDTQLTGREQTQHPLINTRLFADFYPTLYSTLLLTVIGYGGDLLQQWHVGLTRLADPMLQVAYCVARATVEMIVAAHSLQRIKISNRE